MNNLETFLEQESIESEFNELLTLSGLDTNGTLLLKFLINGVEYDIYTSHHIMFNNIKHSPLGLIKKMYDDKGNVTKQWLPFKEDKGAGISGLEQSGSMVYLGDDGYIYTHPDPSRMTDAEVVVDSIKNKGLILTKVKAVGGGGGDDDDTSEPPVPHKKIIAEMTANGEGAFVSTSRLAGFLKSPLIIGLMILGVGYVIYRVNTRKGR